MRRTDPCERQARRSHLPRRVTSSGGAVEGELQHPSSAGVNFNTPSVRELSTPPADAQVPQAYAGHPRRLEPVGFLVGSIVDGPGAIPVRSLGVDRSVGVDVDRRCAVGVRAVPLRPLGAPLHGLGVGAGTHRGASRVRPALVAFVGGPEWRASIRAGSAPVAWFPLGPHEPFSPAYRVSSGYRRRVNVGQVNVTRVNATNVTYVNRRVNGAVTVVPRDAFVRAHPVAASAVAVPRESIRRGRVVPTASVAPQKVSRVGAAPRAAAPPPASVNRPVVVRRAPPDAARAAVRKTIAPSPARPEQRPQAQPRPAPPPAPNTDANRAAQQARERADLAARQAAERARLQARHQADDRTVRNPRQRPAPAAAPEGAAVDAATPEPGTRGAAEAAERRAPQEGRRVTDVDRHVCPA